MCKKQSFFIIALESNESNPTVTRRNSGGASGRPHSAWRCSFFPGPRDPRPSQVLRRVGLGAFPILRAESSDSEVLHELLKPDQGNFSALKVYNWFIRLLSKNY